MSDFVVSFSLLAPGFEFVDVVEFLARGKGLAQVFGRLRADTLLRDPELRLLLGFFFMNLLSLLFGERFLSEVREKGGILRRKAEVKEDVDFCREEPDHFRVLVDFESVNSPEKHGKLVKTAYLLA